jgi:4-diphosphocytidyl-2-C-methyl-D-erythritol kinase
VTRTPTFSSQPQSDDSLVLHAPAKLNLALAVEAPQPAGTPRAGWHRIASWMHPVALGGSVSLRKAGTLSISMDWSAQVPWKSPIDWPLGSDLVVRAHKLMEAQAGRRLAVSIVVTKGTPVGGGMGGGSSEAAATLAGLNQLFGLGISPEQLAELAGKLGSDVAFFLPDERGGHRAAVVSGFGDQIERVPGRQSGVVLVVPRFGCSTPAVYKAFDRAVPGEFAAQRVREMAMAAPDPEALFNDLTQAACVVEPRIAGLMKAVERVAQRPVHMTGSGSVLFVLCKLDDEVGLAEEIEQGCPGVWVAPTRLA